MKYLVSTLAAAVCTVAIASADSKPASRGPAGAPVPEAWDYVRLTPEERYALRMRARALPDAERLQHNKALKAEVDKLPEWLHEALHDERTAMDCQHDTVAPIPKPPLLDAWAYVKRIPTDRYEFRLRARSLSAEERKAYDAHLAKELTKLPAWMQTALADEARRLDERYGLQQCPER